MALSLEKDLEKLRVPKFMSAPWLTYDYVKNNGWYPVCDEWLQNPKYRHVQQTQFGKLPWKSRDEFKPGDIIIFDEFEELEENGEYESDRFFEVSQEDIEQYREKKRDLLPVGVVVHRPLF